MPPAPTASASSRHALRTATAAAHARLDARFADGMRDHTTYAGYLRGMQRFALDFEHALQRPPRLSAWLASDLAALGLVPLVSTGDAPQVRERCERSGWDYVMAGSSIGARRLLREVRLLGFDGDHGATFLARHAVSEDWSAVQACLARFDPQDTREQALIAQGALAAFALADRCFGRALASTHLGMERQQA